MPTNETIRRKRNRDNTGPELGEVEREENEWEEGKDQPSASEQLEKYKPEKDTPADDKKGGLTSEQKANLRKAGKIAAGLSNAIGAAGLTAGMTGYSGGGGQIGSQGGPTNDSALPDADLAYQRKKKDLGLT